MLQKKMILMKLRKLVRNTESKEDEKSDKKDNVKDAEFEEK